SSWTAAPTSTTWKSGCRITNGECGPHVCGYAAALDRSPPEAATLRSVQACAGRLGAADLSPSGAQVSLGRPGGDLGPYVCADLTAMFELGLLCPQDKVETLSDALDALDALSVSVEDADAQTDAEQALFGEPGMPPPKEGWQHSRVLALFDKEDAAGHAARILQAQDFFEGCQLLGVAAVPDQDWVRLTQSQFAPVAITEEFWIVPTWHEPPAQAKQVIR